MEKKVEQLVYCSHFNRFKTMHDYRFIVKVYTLYRVQKKYEIEEKMNENKDDEKLHSEIK